MNVHISAGFFDGYLLICGLLAVLLVGAGVWPELKQRFSKGISSTPAPSVGTSVRKVPLFTGLIVGMLLSVLDQTVFGTALPTIVGELHGVEHMLWVTTAYMLAMVVMLPIYGKLGDQKGHKNLFILAIIIFVAGSVVGARAQDMLWLIVGRSIQGIGGGGLMILAMSIMSSLITPKERARYSWVFGAVFTVPQIVGPVLGGWLTSGPGWRWVFWMNVPLGLLALMAAAVFVPRLPAQAGKSKIDYAGICLIGLASTAIVLVTSWGGSMYDWDSPFIIALIIGAAVCAIGFVFAERRAAEPVMPGWLFKNRNFVLTIVAGLVLGVVMMGTLAYLPMYLQMVTGYSIVESGYLMLPMVLSMVVTSTIVSQIASRTGRYKWSPIAGMAVTAGVLFVLSTMTPATPVWHILVYLGFMGVGLGMCMSILMLIVQNEFPVEHIGIANSTNTYFRTIGMSLGAAVVGAVITNRLMQYLSAHLGGAVLGSGSSSALTPAAVWAMPPEVRSVVISAYNQALAPVYLWIVPLAVVAFVILWFVKEKPLSDSLERMTMAESLEADGMEFAVVLVEDGQLTTKDRLRPESREPRRRGRYGAHAKVGGRHRAGK